jgi:hypothetical protein
MIVQLNVCDALSAVFQRYADNQARVEIENEWSGGLGPRTLCFFPSFFLLFLRFFVRTL